MSLHGTLETFALPDVLALLAATKKTGELRVVGGKTDGRVWFDAGAVVGTEVGRAAGYADAVFELLRLESGKFSFDAEKAAPAPGEPGAIETLLAEAQARLAEWRSIEEVVPSVECGVSLSSEVSDPHIMVTGQQWRALVGVASAGTVSTLIDHLGLGEFETCRTLKGLVEARLVRVAEAPEPLAAPEPAPAAVVQAEAPVPEAVAPAPEPDPEPEPVEPSVEAPVGVQVEAPVPVPAPAPAADPEPTPSRAKIQALTSTPAASAAALEAELHADTFTPEPATAPPTQGEADELVRQVAALESVTVEAPVEVATPPTPTPAPEASVAETAPEASVAETALQPEAPVAETAPQPDAPAAEAPVTEATPALAEGEEPINRGLLLKFLSSVRT